MNKYNWKSLALTCSIVTALVLPSSIAEEKATTSSEPDINVAEDQLLAAAETKTDSGKPPVFSTWFKRTFGIKSKKYEVVDTSKPKEDLEVNEDSAEVTQTEDPKKERKSFAESFKSIFKRSKSPETVSEDEIKEDTGTIVEAKDKDINPTDKPTSVANKNPEKPNMEKVSEKADTVTEETPVKEEAPAKEIAKVEEPQKEKKSFSESFKSIFKKSDKGKTTVAESDKTATQSKKRGFRNPFQNFWKKSSQDEKTKKTASKSSNFHDPKQISKPEYDEPADKEAALGVVGEVKGDQIGPFSRPGKYDLSGTQTGLLLPINNKDELNTKEGIVSVIMKQPALMSVDSYSSLSIHKVISINEIILKRGRFRLKTLDKAGLWTIRGRETLLSLSENSDVIFDMTGTLITKIFVLSGEAHCLPKLGEKPIKLQAGQMVHSGLSETKTMDISDEQNSFFESRFSLISEENLTAKLDAAGVFSSRRDKNWPMDSKIYSGILCTNCSYAFDTREDYYDVCPVCHTSLVEISETDEDGNQLIHPAKSKSSRRKSYNWSNWFFGIKSKKSSK